MNFLFSGIFFCETKEAIRAAGVRAGQRHIVGLEVGKE
jgi:hypothetical protein